MSKSKGGVYERELLRLFFDNGFSGVRVAGSGASSMPSPDLVIGRAGEVLAFEVKSTVNDYVYISKAQLDNLLSFSHVFGAKPLVAVKFINRGWRFFEAPEIDSKNARFSFSDSSIFFENFLSKNLNYF
jgi:Holliday junction resolvase